MDIGEFLQAIVGALVQQPDGVLVAGAQKNSAILEAVQRAYPPGGYVGEIGILHTFVLVVGLGLLFGTSLSTGVFIAAFVVLGVAGGLFAMAQLFGVLGVNVAGLSGAMTGALGSLVSHQYVADFYVVLPAIVLAAGLARWRLMLSRTAIKKTVAVNDSMKHYCSRCGTVMKVGYRRCHVCGEKIPKKTGGHCTTCGRIIAKDARYCWFCGSEASRAEGEERCPACGGSASEEDRFCPHCGIRLSWPPPATESEEGGQQAGQGDASGTPENGKFANMSRGPGEGRSKEKDGRQNLPREPKLMPRV